MPITGPSSAPRSAAEPSTTSASASPAASATTTTAPSRVRVPSPASHVPTQPAASAASSAPTASAVGKMTHSMTTSPSGRTSSSPAPPPTSAARNVASQPELLHATLLRVVMAEIIRSPGPTHAASGSPRADGLDHPADGRAGHGGVPPIDLERGVRGAVHHPLPAVRRQPGQFPLPGLPLLLRRRNSSGLGRAAPVAVVGRRQHDQWPGAQAPGRARLRDRRRRGGEFGGVDLRERGRVRERLVLGRLPGGQVAVEGEVVIARRMPRAPDSAPTR